MRIVITDPEDFKAEIKACDKVIDLRYRVDQVPQQAEKVTFDWIIWMTAVCETFDGQQEVQALYECATELGDTQEPGDAAIQSTIRGHVGDLHAEADARGIRLGKGKIELV